MESDPLSTALAEFTASGLAVIDEDGAVLMFNRPMHEIFGYTREEFAALPPFGLVPASEREAAVRRHRQFFKEGRSFDTTTVELAQKNGDPKWVEMTLDRFEAGGQTLMSSELRDVSSEFELKAHIEEAQRIGQLGSWQWDLVTGVVAWSDEMYRIAGRDREEFSPSAGSLQTLVHPDDLAKVREGVQQLGEREPGYRRMEYRILRPDGSTRIVYGSSSVIHDNEGQVVRVIGTMQDVTQRAEAARELTRLHVAVAENAAEISDILESVPNAIVKIEQDGTIVRVNSSVRQMFGWTPDELVGRNVQLIVGGDDRDPHQRYVDRYVETGEPSTEEGLATGRSREVIAQRKDGSTFPADLRIAESAPGQDGRHFIGVITDISELIEAQRQLREREALLAGAELLAHLGSSRVHFPEGTFTYSDEAYRIYRRSREEWEADGEGGLETVLEAIGGGCPARRRTSAAVRCSGYLSLGTPYTRSISGITLEGGA